MEDIEKQREFLRNYRKVARTMRIRATGRKAYISRQVFDATQPFIYDDISYLLAPPLTNAFPKGKRTRTKPRRYEDEVWVPGSGAVQRKGYDGTDMSFKG